ncbi:MAG: threonine/serine dehydratase [Pseudomonadota bacterium]
MSDLPLPSFDDVKAAAGRIENIAIQTPLLRNPVLDKMACAEIWIKPECLQATGSFKIRGATNRLAQITNPAERAAGVVAYSSGNHAQGVARAAKRFELPAMIVMPQDAPQVKVDGVRRDGAEIHFYDRLTQSREDIAAEIADARGAIIVPSYDDPDIIAGQGTMGLETARATMAADAPLDHFICCAGGGGLVAGTALAFEKVSPSTQIWTAEPQGFDDHKRSLEAGTICRILDDAKTICDAIMTPEPGTLTFAINSQRLAGGFAVSEHEVQAAMAFAFTHLKLIVEPGGAVALAAALYGLPDAMKGQRIGVVLSGGNVDPERYAAIIGGAKHS